MSQAPHEFADQLCMLCHCGSPADCCCSRKHATLLADAQKQHNHNQHHQLCTCALVLVLCCKSALCASPRMHCDIELHECRVCQAAHTAAPVHQRQTCTPSCSWPEWSLRPGLQGLQPGSALATSSLPPITWPRPPKRVPEARNSACSPRCSQAAPCPGPNRRLRPPCSVRRVTACR